MIDAQLRGSQTMYTYMYMRTGARYMLELAEKTTQEPVETTLWPAGPAQDCRQFYSAIASLLYSAFMLEAYFNHLGQECDEDWYECFERKPPLKKFQRLAKKGCVEFKEKDRPYSMVKELFSFRNSVAHGRNVTEEINRSIDWSETNLRSIGFPKPEWLDFPTPERAREVLEDVEKLICELHKACGQPDDPFRSAGKGLFFITRTSSGQVTDGSPAYKD